MKRLLCLAILGVLGATVSIGCQASAEVGTDADHDHGSYHHTEVKRETPAGDTVYERHSETKTEVSP